jgi:4-diphosphocytidyl-2-C-methyl-D-erythritol kinase
MHCPAKLNLSLRIVGRRPDGYHLLESSMAPISVYDRMTLSFAPAADIEILCRGSKPNLPVGKANLAAKAAEVFLRRTGLTGRIVIDIEKDIPMGAGLGGGSSDAAAALKMLAHVLTPGIADDQLATWSLELGADVPFFVYGRPARVAGIGEKVTPSSPIVSGPIVVAFPGASLSTADVYKAYDESLTRSVDLSSGTTFASDDGSFRGILVNDLEAAATWIFPPLRLLKMRMFELGACGALMTGSGSAVFGIWKDATAADAAATQLSTVDGIWARSVQIIEQSPSAEIREL